MALEYIQCLDAEPPNIINSQTSTQAMNGVYILMYFIIVLLLAYFILSLFIAICCCKPSYSGSTSLIQIIFHMGSIAILLISAILFYWSITKLKSLGSDQSYSYKMNMRDLLHQYESLNFKAVYNNILKYTENTVNTSKILKKITIDYNSTFSNQNGLFSKSFNNLYNSPDAPNNLKFNLKEMDKSRTHIISTIVTFADKHELYSNSIQKKVAKINENSINSTISIVKNQKHHNKQIQSYSYTFMDYVFSYIIVTGLLILCIIIGITYFFSNKCSWCCFCSYSLYAFLLISAGFLSNLYLSPQTYNDITSYCYYATRSTSPHQSDEIFNLNNWLNNFKFDEELVKMANEYSQKKNIECLYNNLSSKVIHKNYNEIYSQYSFIDEYRTDLNQIVSVINNNEKVLQTMRYLFKKIIKDDEYAYPIINEIKEKSILFLKTTNQSIKKTIMSSYESTCNSMFKFFNICLASSFFMFIGLFLLSISVCIRRKSMKFDFLSGYEDSQLDDVETTRDKNTSTKTNDNVKTINDNKDDDPFTVESNSTIKAYFIGYLKFGQQEIILDNIFEQEGELGIGYYLFLDKDELLSKYKDIYPKYIVTYLIPCTVTARKVLNIGNKKKFYHYPQTIEKYQFEAAKFIANNGTHRLLVLSKKFIEFGKEERIG